MEYYVGEHKKENNTGYGKGYGKRPLWQWIALYVVVGGIFYYLAYVLLIKSY